MMLDIRTSMIICAVGLLLWLTVWILERIVMKKRYKALEEQQGRGEQNERKHNNNDRFRAY